jgi:hypothetical protein
MHRPAAPPDQCRWHPADGHPDRTGDGAAAAPAQAQEPVPERRTPAFSEGVSKAIGPMVEGKAKLVFFRPRKLAGSVVGFIVREQEEELGKLRSGKYFTVDARPGKHTYTVHSESTDNAIIEVEAGETYFIAGSISMGFLVGHPHLTFADVTAFESALPKMEPAIPLS